MAKRYFRSNYSEFPSEPCYGVCIPLTMGQHTIIDAEDFDRVSQHIWQARAANRTFYARANIVIGGKPTHTAMGQFILESPEDVFVDHHDRQPLNNRKSNLRTCSKAENNYNRDIPMGKHGYKGVALTCNGWRAGLTYKGRRYGSPPLDTVEFAAAVYDCFSHRLHGEFGIRNFNLTEEEQSDIWEWLLQQTKYPQSLEAFNAK